MWHSAAEDSGPIHQDVQAWDFTQVFVPQCSTKSSHLFANVSCIFVWIIDLIVNHKRITLDKVTKKGKKRLVMNHWMW